MTRAELLALRSILETEYVNRTRLGGYSADAEPIRHLTGNLLDITNHLIQQDKEIARLKRAPKKKKK